MGSLNNKLSAFIDNNRHTFTNKLVDTRSTTDALLSINNPSGNSVTSLDANMASDVLIQLDHNVQLLIDKFTRLIIEAHHVNRSD